jgi:hypothetical protein
MENTRSRREVDAAGVPCVARGRGQTGDRDEDGEVQGESDVGRTSWTESTWRDVVVVMRIGVVMGRGA